MSAPARKDAPTRFGPAQMMAGPPVQKPLNFKVSVGRMVALLRPQRRLLWISIALGVTSVALMVIGPRILGHATNLIFNGAMGGRLPAELTKEQAVEAARAAGNNTFADMLSAMNIVPGTGIDFGAVAQVLTWAMVVYLAASFFAVFQFRLITEVVQRSIYRLREDVEAKLSRLPLSYFDGQPRGEVLSKATNDIDNVAQTLQNTLSQLINSVLTIVGVLAMMFWISPWLALIALVTVPVSVWVTMRIGKKAQPQFIAQWASTGRLNGHIEEMFTGHSLVKVFGQQREAAETFRQHNDALYQASFKAQFISGMIQPAMFFIGNLNYVIVAVIGGLWVASGSMSLGDVQAFIQYSRQFSQPLTQVAAMSNLVQSGVASAERVFALLDSAEQSPEPASPARLNGTRGEVAFERVTFRYKEDQPLIEDLSLIVQPGQTVAIVGPTGAGKTTLVNLLMRFYEVNGGRITLDGTDITTMTREDLRSRMGMVLQDTWLFGGTIAQNIAYGADSDSGPRSLASQKAGSSAWDRAAGEPTRDRIVEAARAAHVDRFVRTLPDGYETVLDDEGSNLSAGEKQLVTIARAFLAEPSILILDEATSSVDTRTEVLIQRAMATLRSGRTSFVIAHRLSTIRNADVILVMENGRIVEQGSHEKLIAEGGAYARLYAAQFAEPVTEDLN